MDTEPLVDRVREAVIVRDPGDQILFWSQGAEHLYGWGAADAVGRRAAEVLADDPDEWDAARRQTLAAGGWAGELGYRTRSGRRGVARCRWTLLHAADRRPAALLGVDSVGPEEGVPMTLGAADPGRGAFAEDLAHELNNVLTPVVMSLKLLRGQPLGGDAREILATAEASMARVVAMMDRLHALATSPGRLGQTGCTSPGPS